MPILKTLEQWNKKFWYETVIRLLFRNKPISLPLSVSDMRRVLLIRRDMIGDMIITTSFIRSLHGLKQDLELDVYAAPQSRVVIEKNPRISTIFSSKFFGRNFWRELRQARQRNYDIILCLSYTGTTLDGLLANLISRRAIKVGMREPSREELYRYWFNAQIDVGKNAHGATEPLWKSLHRFLTNLFGVPFDESMIQQEIFITESEKSEAEKFISEKNLTRYVVFNLSARMAYRKWGKANNLAFLCEVATRYSSLQFVIVSSPHDRNEAVELAKEVALPNVHLAPSMNFRALCHLISKTILVVSPDTSIVHVAATYQVPSIVLCTQLSSGVEWTPLHTPFINIYTERAEAISTIAPKRVIDAFDTILCQPLHNTTTLSP